MDTVRWGTKVVGEKWGYVGVVFMAKVVWRAFLGPIVKEYCIAGGGGVGYWLKALRRM